MNAPRSNDPARQERLRALNLELVFRHVLAADAPVSRTELAAATGLTRPTITRIVEELIAGRLVTETGATPDGRAGRPRMGLTVSRSGPAGLGLDIRTDGLAACVVDLTGTVRHLAFAPFTDNEAAAVLERLGRMATEAAEAAAAEGLTVVTATLAVPGPTDGGVVRTAPALGWRDVDAGAMLAAHLRDLDRRPLRGSHGWGGELGHLTVDPDGKPCRCGSRGCLQTYASLAAILAADTLPAGLTADAALLTWADAGRPVTLAALDTAATALGIAIANVLNLLDIDTVLLGGSYALVSSWLVTGVEAEINQRVLSARWAPVTVRPATLGPDAAAIGAAMAVIDRIRRDPTDWLASGR